MGIFNRHARFIERRKQQLALEPGERDRRKTPHIYPRTIVHQHNTTVVNNTPVVVDNSPDLLTTVLEAEIIADAMQPSESCTPADNCCAPSGDSSFSQPDTPCYDSPSSDTPSSDFGGFGGGDTGGGGAGSDW